MPPTDRDPLRHIRVTEFGCHEWTQHCDKRYGYGRKHYKNRLWEAHRLSWTLQRGEIPEGMSVLHKCHNPPCINVDHLYLGTHQQNMDDMKAANRHVWNGHTPNGRALAPAEYDDIQRRYEAGGVSQQSLADEYGVGQKHVSRIVRGWRPRA